MKKKSSITLKSGRPSSSREAQPTLSRLAAEKNLRRVNFQIEADDHQKLKIYAAQQGKTITTLMMHHINILIKNVKSKSSYE